MSRSADRGAWLAVINAIKTAYRRPLVYAAQANEYPNVSFWDQLNLIGIDAYFPLSTVPTTNVSALQAAWVPIQQQLSAFAASLGRQILFTEVGYPSQVGATVQPWNNQYSTVPSQQGAGRRIPGITCRVRRPVVMVGRNVRVVMVDGQRGLPPA